MGAEASQNVVIGLEFVCESRILDDADVHGPREEGGDHGEGKDQRQAEGEQAGHRARALVGPRFLSLRHKCEVEAGRLLGCAFFAFGLGVSINSIFIVNFNIKIINI